MDTKTRPVGMQSSRDTIQTSGHIQTESEGIKKDIPCKWKSKALQTSKREFSTTKPTLQQMLKELL